MGRQYRIHSQDDFYFVTFTVIRWIDVFIREEYRCLFLDSVRYCQREKGLQVGAWCIMSNHIHLIIGTKGAHPIQDIIRDLKAYTSRHIRKMLEASDTESRKSWMLWMMYQSGIRKSNNKDFQFWMQHSHPIALTSAALVRQRMNYLHQNPVKAGWVDEPEHWRYSSARDYAGQRGLLTLYPLQ